MKEPGRDSDMHQILRPVVDKILSEVSVQIPNVPSDLQKTYAAHWGWGAAAAGAATGAYYGAGVGIAAGPLGAIAGTVPGAIVGAVFGYFAGEKVGAQFEKRG